MSQKTFNQEYENLLRKKAEDKAAANANAKANANAAAEAARPPTITKMSFEQFSKIAPEHRGKENPDDYEKIDYDKINVGDTVYIKIQNKTYLVRAIPGVPTPKSFSYKEGTVTSKDDSELIIKYIQGYKRFIDVTITKDESDGVVFLKKSPKNNTPYGSYGIRRGLPPMVIPGYVGPRKGGRMRMKRRTAYKKRTRCNRRTMRR